MTMHSHGRGEMTVVPLDASMLSRIGALARLAMGLVFVTAGAAKSWDPVIFYWEVVSYLEMLTVESPGLAQSWASAAIYLAPVEVAVGLALLLNWRPRTTCPGGRGNDGPVPGVDVLRLAEWGQRRLRLLRRLGGTLSRPGRG